MSKNFKIIWNLFDKRQKEQFLYVQILMVVSALLQLAGIGSITPFIAIATNPSLLDSSSILSDLYLWSGIEGQQNFLVFLAVLSLAVLICGTFLSSLTLWRSEFFANRVGTEISNKLYQSYIYQPWLYHITKNTSHYMNQISNESLRVLIIMQAFMQFNTQIFLVLAILVMLISINPIVILFSGTIFGMFYLLIYKLFRPKLLRHGENISLIYSERTQAISETFGGIKEVLLLQKQDNFYRNFEKKGDVLIRSRTIGNFLGQVPRFFLELTAIGIGLLTFMYLLKSSGQNLSDTLIFLSVYSMSVLKLLPAMQGVYVSVSNIKSNISALNVINKDFQELHTFPPFLINSPEKESIVFKEKICLQDIIFSYPGKKEHALDGITIEVITKETIGIVGSSGSGKTTLLNVILGLLPPNQGIFKIDEIVLRKKEQILAWQKLLGYVPQNIFLTSGTIAENIAFGIEKDKIDFKQIEKIIELAHLKKFVDDLSDGFNTKVGERGMRLSGGQCQRIGIARALYHDPEILVFDEATSALDGITENLIMEAINDFSGYKTMVIVAHRLKTVKRCNLIYMLEKGHVIDQGTYQELLDKNKHFQKMHEHT